MTKLCRAAAVIVLVLAVSAAYGDRLTLSNGDVITGTVLSISEGTCTFESSSLGKLEIALSNISEIVTDESAVILLKEQEAARDAVLRVEQGQMFLVDGEFKEPTQLGGIAAFGDAAVAKALQDPDRFIFSGDLELGLDGYDGNTEKLSWSGAGNLYWKNPVWEIHSFARYRYADQVNDNDERERTQNELYGGLEVDRWVSKMVSLFGKTTAENDEFEDLTLRSITTAGAKVHWSRAEPILYFNAFGLGYQYEQFDNDDTEEAVVASLESNLRWKINSRLDFLQKTVWYPQFESLDAYRLTAETALRLFLNKDHSFYLKTGIEHDYNSQPRDEDIEKLDTYYFARLGYSF